MLLATSASISAAAGPAQAIVNGQQALDRAFPWTVALVLAGTSPVQGQFCGGTLIAADRVLTAAHCIDPGGPNEATASSFDVLVGQTSLAGAATSGYTAGSRIPVSQISLHSQADVANLRFDVAILTLAEPVPSHLQGAIVQPVVPSGESVAPPTNENLGVDPTSLLASGWGVGTNGFAFGWGKANASGYDKVTSAPASGFYPDVLRWVGSVSGGATLERLPDTYCAGRYPGEFQPADMLCAGPDSNLTSKAPDACSGDSGGPLLRKSMLPALDYPTPPHEQFAGLQSDPANWRLMGVVSWGPADSCGDPNLPGVYARVGAPAIHGYVTNAAPAAMPTLVDPSQGATIVGGYGPGGAITCQSGNWQHATSFEYLMWRDLDGNRLRAGTGETLLAGSTDGVYEVTSTDVAGRTIGDQIGCTVIARGPGGYATSQAASLLNLTIPQAPLPPGTSPPAPTTPAPTTPTPSVDTLAPRMIKDFVVCGISSCKVSIFATDTGLAATGVRRVAASLVITRPVKCKKGSRKRKCTKTIARSLKLRQRDEIYSATVKKLRRGDTQKLRVRAFDHAGNASTMTLRLKLRLKKPSR